MEKEEKWVYLFNEGNASMRDELGGKGAGLAEMTNMGLPVPPGFIISTAACRQYYVAGATFPRGMWEQALTALKTVEQATGKAFGDPANPLLVSVRSGAKFSMPGMMDTVLNLGLNDKTVAGIIHFTHNERFAFDAYRRLIQMFGKIVLGIGPEHFETALEGLKQKTGAKLDTDLAASDLKALVATFKDITLKATGQPFPQDPYQQLRSAIEAVFASWNSKRATEYRNFYKIPHDLGTAISVVTMVFGNMGDNSGTGVLFTRNPGNGTKELYGEYLLNAQGEDVVAGVRTPHKINQLAQELPEIYLQLKDIAKALETHYRDAQDVEFTIERGKLNILQTRSAKRTAAAAVKIAVDMEKEGLVTEDEALLRVEPEQVSHLLHGYFDDAAKEQAITQGRLLTKGLNASPGAGRGKVVFDAERAHELAIRDKDVILVRPETSPDDVSGMLIARGIVTARGGATSHAAVVARGLGKPCVAGCEDVRVDLTTRRFTVNGVTVLEGDVISIDGTTGEVFLGDLPIIEPKFAEQKDLNILLGWADKVRRLGVRANADQPRDAAKALEFGAEGVGLCRTEHMFFGEERLPIMQKMILAAGELRAVEASSAQPSSVAQVYHEALAELLEFQKSDFKDIFRAMEGKPIVVRLLDPPLHEFLPHYEDLLVEITELRIRGGDMAKLKEKEQLLRAVARMRETNPMLGLRGCRLGIMFGAINEMQVRAILYAACELGREGVESHVEIMIPLVGHANELKTVREQLEKVARDVEAEMGQKVTYKFGTMIEVPRAALTADEIAQYAEFFSFGTNDLTQTTFGISRDDAEGKFLLQYVERGILPNNPFQVLDRQGVGKLIETGVKLGRSVRPDLSVGICGEHGGEPSSIEFCHQLGLDYVSCSPYRVPIARLAAAQAALATGERDR